MSPKVLSGAMPEGVKVCDILEIRYDFFEEPQWKSLSSKIRGLAPHAMQIGTIRLKSDGGTFPTERAGQRLQLWKNIFDAAGANPKDSSGSLCSNIPEIIDLEEDFLEDYEDLKQIAKGRSTIIISKHNFKEVPSTKELNLFADKLLNIQAQGLKIAAMSHCESDNQRLYQFIQKYASQFKYFAAFGMGEAGKTSRINSLNAGANLTYGAIEKTVAPGQMNVLEMRSKMNKK